jgi:hypothetical protein
LAPLAAIFAGTAQIKSKSLQDLSGKFPGMQDDIHSSRKLAAALIAGLIAIVVHTSMIETPPLLTPRPDWAAFSASLFAPAPREKPRWNPS